MTEPFVWLDGTQQPPPEPPLPDPLAGLITGEVLPREPAPPRLVPVAAPPRRPQVGQVTSAVFTEKPTSSARRNRPRATKRPAAVSRPQAVQPAKPRMSLITLLVTLFILFLIVRAVISTITGS